MNTKVQEELIKSANLIREKYRALKRGKFIDEELRLENLKPITEPLEKMAKRDKDVIVVNPLVPFQSTHGVRPSTPKSAPPPPSRALQFNFPTTKNIEFGKLATKYLSNYLQSNDKRNTDTTYGLRKEQDSNDFSIGSSKAEINNDDITVEGKTYKGTEGLWSLLTLKEPKAELITDEDMADYKEILENTNAHKKGYKANAPISSNMGRKYKKIIGPLFATKSGEGLKVVTENPIDYVYWNDPNELIDRLRLLILSKQAGNNNLSNEEESIIEELREANIIY